MISGTIVWYIILIINEDEKSKKINTKVYKGESEHKTFQ